jgi:hypothetical protein
MNVKSTVQCSARFIQINTHTHVRDGYMGVDFICMYKYPRGDRWCGYLTGPAESMNCKEIETPV